MESKSTYQGTLNEYDIPKRYVAVSKRSWSSRMLSCVLYGSIVIIALAFWYNFGLDYYTSIGPKVSVDDSEAPFDWNKGTPSPELTWVPCLNEFECARFEVPMDYNEPEGDKVDIALLRVKAKVPPTSKEYRGPILFNPGGPGGSGVALVFLVGKSFQTILGEEYDIVGFDPRGIGETTPQFSLFTDPIERALWGSKAGLTVNASLPGTLYAEHARSSIMNQLARKNERLRKISQYSSTALVARDMLTISRAHGYEKLQYWGFSYGTVLGATFAAMFPQNVGRLVIDGVVNLPQWFSAQWYKHLIDADKVLLYWYKECLEAQDLCDLRGNSTHELGQRVNNILESLISQPVAALNNSTYGVVNYGIVKALLMLAVYSPFQALAPLTSALAALEKGDAAPILSLASPAITLPRCDAKPSPFIPVAEGGYPVLCGERFGPGRNIENVIRELQHSKSISVLQDIWVNMAALPCTGWDIEQKYHFSGPFNSTTSFPLLIIGNTADPVTPLLGAQLAAKEFPNSRLMVVDTPGHCSIAAVSPVSTMHIRNYFREGILPPEGTVCPIESTIFQRKVITESLDTKELPLVEAARYISQHANLGRYIFPPGI